MTARTKLCLLGKENNEGHVLYVTTSRGLRGLVLIIIIHYYRTKYQAFSNLKLTMKDGPVKVLETR